LTVKEVAIALGFDVDTKELDNADDKLKKTKSNTKEVSNEMTSLSSVVKKLGGLMAAAFSINAIKNFANECVQLASQVQQTNQKFEAVFGELTETADNWADNMANAWGRSKNQIKTYLADEQNMLYGLSSSYFESEEAGRQWAMEMSQDMTSLAMDIASFANLDEDSAVQNMTKAVMGQTEAARVLGAVLDDNTRALAMQQLGYAGTYESLKQNEKMMVNLTAITNQSADAIGDMDKSMREGLFESKARMSKAAAEELKETIGTGLLEAFTALQGIQYDLCKGMNEFAKEILYNENGESRLKRATEKLNVAWNKTVDIVKRMKDAVTKLADKFGGMENLLKLVAIGLGAIMLVMKWEQITKMVGALGKLKSALMGVNLSAVATVAALVVLVLLIQDFIVFLQGGDSVIGKWLGDAGVDVDAFREKCLAVIEKIKTYAGIAVEKIQGIIGKIGPKIAKIAAIIFGVIGVVKILATTFGVVGKAISIVLKVLKVIGPILKVIGVLVKGIWVVVQFIIGFVGGFVSTVGLPIIAVIAAIIAAIIGVVLVVKNWAKISEWIKEKWQAFKDFMANLWNGIKDKAKEAWNGVKQKASDAWNGIKAKWSGAKSWFSDKWNGIKEGASTAWNNIKEGSSALFGAITEQASSNLSTFKSSFDEAGGGITGVFAGVSSVVQENMSTMFTTLDELTGGKLSAIAEKFTGLKDSALTWGSDMIQGFVDGIKEKWESFKETISGLGDTVKSYLHFSRPDVGPLADYETWMPDFMTGLAKGISDNKELVTDKVKSLASSVQALMQSAVASPQTVSNSTVSNNNSSVTQNVSISNSYTGTAQQGAKAVTNTMKKSANDATTAMAHALQYARG